MKLSKITGLAVCVTACALAEETAPPLTFTYLTLTSDTVQTATTTYSALSTASTPGPSSTITLPVQPASSPYDGWNWAPWSERSWPWGTQWYPLGKHTPTTTPPSTQQSTSSRTATITSYVLNYTDLAYPLYQNLSTDAASAAAAPGLPTTQQFVLEAAQLFLFFANANSTNCQTCKNTFKNLQASMKVDQELLARISIPFCQSVSAVLPFGLCYGLFHVGSTDIGGIFPALDIDGDDGSALCAFIFGLCELPPVPELDLLTLFNGTTKPAPMQLKPSGKTPLKVMHFSDYHLDLRYVVGSEANCGGQLCCRVFPYTNISAPINQSASLFGNYLCDTPDALGTSMFRNVPKATGLDWDEFSFGIFTGDLVSHDIWELTKPYVLAEELESYQQFFNGVGNVKIYPTLGNHDSFPHAFTSFPYQNNVLPANASYPVQQLYNYQAVSAAWVNYGWLSAEDAATVVSSGLGIYRTKTKEGLIIISLNSDVWYYSNIYAYINANTIDPTGTFALLVNYLLEAEAAGQPVWIIQHVNIGGSTDYEALPAASDLYYAIVDRFNNTIRGTFFGHTHRDEFGIFYANNATTKSADEATAIGWIGQSVTPYSNLNAGFRYYLVDPDTFAIIDSLNYYANVSNTLEWTAAGDVTWEFEYSAKQTYDINGTLGLDAPMTPGFWHTVAEDIAYNSSQLRKYTDLRTKLKRPYAPPTAQNMQRTLCGLTSMSVPVFERCLNSNDSTSQILRKRDTPAQCDHSH